MADLSNAKLLTYIKGSYIDIPTGIRTTYLSVWPVQDLASNNVCLLMVLYLLYMSTVNTNCSPKFTCPLAQ